MATSKQKEAARRNIGKARQAQSARAHVKDVPRHSEGMSTADKNKLADQEFAFPAERKEPLTDARHVRNAIARFDQVEGVSDAERDQDDVERKRERHLRACPRHGVHGGRCREDVERRSHVVLALPTAALRAAASASPPAADPRSLLGPRAGIIIRIE